MGFLWKYTLQQKKNDHIFHEACVTYVINFYDNERIKKGRNPIPTNIIWIDNCPTQYKCRQNFRNIATSADRIDSYIEGGSNRIHKFGSKYRFKGS